jgi:hypothetical protein
MLLPDPNPNQTKAQHHFLANLGRHQKDAFPEPTIICHPVNT